MEIGKKYEYNNGTFSGDPRECVAKTSDGHFILRYYSAGVGKPVVHVFQTEEPESWVEVIEPKKGVAYLLVCERKNGETYTVSFSKDQTLHNDKLIAKINVPWTEGQGL